MCSLNHFVTDFVSVNKLSGKEKEACVYQCRFVCMKEKFCYVIKNIAYNDGLWFQQNTMVLKVCEVQRRKQVIVLVAP
jgi:hypothetical protein